VYEPGDPAHHHLFVSFDVGDLAEAAAHSGHRDEARSIMRDVESLARPSNRICTGPFRNSGSPPARTFSALSAIGCRRLPERSADSPGRPLHLPWAPPAADGGPGGSGSVVARKPAAVRQSHCSGHTDARSRTPGET
jgi:hypothetical protein